MDLITQRLTVAKFLDAIEPKYPEWGTGLRETFSDSDLDEMPFIRKGLVLTLDDLEFDIGERTEVAKISTLALDRDNEVLLPEGADWRHFLENPVVPYAHDYSSLPVGRSLWVKLDSKTAPTTLIAKTRYATAAANPIGEQVFQLHREGILTAKSVGFIPTAWKSPIDDGWGDTVISWRSRRDDMLAMKGIEKGRRPKEPDPQLIYTKWTLLEYSPVPVPSNPEAVSMAISKGILTEEEAIARGFIEDKADEKFRCECIECGNKIESEEHCADIKCPECGGQMRREERPGPGQKDLVSEVREIAREEARTIFTEMFDQKDGSPADITEVSEEDAQKIREMVGNTLETKPTDSKPTAEELLEFAKTGLV